MARLAQDQWQAAGSLIDECLTAAEAAAEFQASEVEASVLIAACSDLAANEQSVRSVLHQRRYRRAIDRAQDLMPDNPRLLLVRFINRSEAPAGPTAQVVLDAFRRHSDSLAFPDWGEAEALAIAGEQALDTGDWGRARDLIEEALIIAPAYAHALELRARLSEIAAQD
jgi:hypothetical protein